MGSLGSLLFWQLDPPDPDMAVTLWRSFLDDMAGSLVMYVVLGAVVITACYTAHAWTRRISQPADVFATYTPMVWLAIAALPAIALTVAYWLEFERRFPGARVSWVGGAVTLAIVGGVLTLIVGYAAMWVPGITPRKFRYRPRALLLGRRSVR